MNDNVTQTSMFGTEKIYKILLRLGFGYALSD